MTMTHSKGQGRGYAYFDLEYLVQMITDGDRYATAYFQSNGIINMDILKNNSTSRGKSAVNIDFLIANGHIYIKIEIRSKVKEFKQCILPQHFVEFLVALKISVKEE